MKKLVTVLLSALLLQVSASAVTIISFNIRNGESKDGTNSWQYRCPASVLMLQDQNPDIFCIQEAMSYQVAFLKEYCEVFSYVGVGSEDGKKKGEHNVIFYNKKAESVLKSGTFWLSDTPDTPSLGWGAGANRTAVWALMKDKASGKKFYLVSTRLDNESEEARKNGLNLIVERIQGMNTEGLPVIVAGDFNMEAEDSAMFPIKSSMKDARSVAAKSDDHFTFNGWGTAKKTIDHIWFSGIDSCTEFETVTKRYMDRTFISDHFPVKATFIF